MTDPAGSIMLAQERLRTTLASCASLRDWMNVVTVEDALARIHHEALPPSETGDVHTRAELEALRPFVLVWTQEEAGYVATKIASGDAYGFDERGSLLAVFEQSVPADIAHDPAEIDLRFKSAVGLIMDDLRAAAGVGEGLAVREIRGTGPYRSHEDERVTKGDAVMYELAIDWE